MMEENNIIELRDDKGNIVKYRLLDVIKYNEKIFVVFYPVIEGDTEVIICRVEKAENEKESLYIPEADENTINYVYKMFKEKYKWKIKFTD